MYNHISHSASQICRVSFYIVILLARINAHIQALLRQGFGIPSENRKVKRDFWQTAIREHQSGNQVVCESTARQFLPPKAHKSPTDVLDLFYAHANSSEWGLIGHFARSAFRRTPSGRLTCRGFLVKMQHKQHFFT